MDCSYIHKISPSRVAHLVEVSSYTPKGLGFNSWAEHMPRVRVPRWALERQLIDVSLPLSFPPPFSKNQQACPWVRIKNNEV